MEQKELSPHGQRGVLLECAAQVVSGLGFLAAVDELFTRVHAGNTVGGRETRKE